MTPAPSVRPSHLERLPLMAKISATLPVLAIVLAIGAHAPQAQAESTLGEIKTFAFDICPSGSVVADGALRPVSTYTTLYAVVGNNFGAGANAQSFMVPDLAGRAMIGDNETTVLGAKSGAVSAVLTFNQSPIGRGPRAAQVGAGDTSGIGAGVAPNPGASAVSTMPPYLALTQCIVTEGNFPIAP
jgi:microcystin-dependent protein